MAGVVSNCKKCGETIWDEQTRSRLCPTCEKKPIKTLAAKTRIAELEESVRQAHREIEKLKAIDTAEVTMDLTKITLAHKVKTFDQLHETCVTYFDQVMKDGRYPERDDDHYMFEGVMLACLGPKVYKIMQKVVVR